MVTKMYRPKRSCPRNLGSWYCDDCRARCLDESSSSDYPVDLEGCDKKLGDRVCGQTHLGYELCPECEAEGREKSLHVNEYEVVAVIRSSK